MAKDLLFLLKPDFSHDGKGPFFCPSCASLEGLLSFYPKLRQALDVRYVEFPRPRKDVIAELGAENQGLPALVLNANPAAASVAGLEVHMANGRRFMTSVTDIGRYLARTQGIGEPH